MALGTLVLIAVAGLAIDASNLYLTRRQAQNATDLAALAAGKQLAASTFVLTTAPKSGDKSVNAAHDFAALNGFPTAYSTACDSASATNFSATWFDSPGFSCAASSGFRTKVVVNVPAVAVANVPVPDACSSQAQFSCFQVTMTARVDTMFGRAFGLSTIYPTVTAIVRTTPAIQGYSIPPPVAAYLYQPQTGCGAAAQCFNEALPASRSNLTCTGGNCPTFWVQSGAQPSFYGTDGSKTIPVAGDIATLQSNGDMVIQDKTVFCDPYGGAKCTGAAVGVKGFSLASGSKLYCSGFGSGSSGGLIPCTTSGQPSLNQVAGNETTFAALSWTPSVDTSGWPTCGALVLNGGTVQSSFTVGAASSACYDTIEPYVIQPGKYQYIVINHGTYEFETGLYDLTGTAPVNTATGGGYVANGIDHANETSAKDWDLCSGGQPNSCPTLTASVWIGHGGGSFGAFVSGTSSSCVVGGTNNGGGGDQTIISGSGVSFRFESTASGFVSTNEVNGISLTSPGVGFASAVGGAPMLFDLENSSFIHLDGSAPGKNTSQFTGLVYQTQSATAGGVELNPGLASGKKTPALDGQVYAYSLTIFGKTGTAIDFTDGYGGISQPGIQTSGKAESSLVSSTSLAQAVDSLGNPIAGQETLTIKYTDEWALDAYDLYLKINNARPVFFSQGIWNPTPLSGAAVPPATNTPGDSSPAYPAAAPPAGYTASADPVTGQNTDWTMTIGSGSTASTFEVSGNWTWGHEMDIPSASSGDDLATIKYTFPIPKGTSVSITVFLTDGDHCGDYYIVNATFNNIGQPGGGSQSAGSVMLVR